MLLLVIDDLSRSVQKKPRERVKVTITVRKGIMYR